MMLSIQDLPLDQTEETVDRLTRLLDMAFWHNQAGNQEAAITASEAALALNPNSTTAHSLLGTLYEKKGDDAQAIRHFEAVLALNPDSPADAAKLDQLRRGVHVRAAAPPIAHQWLPPAALKLGPQLQKKWSALAGSPLTASLATANPVWSDPQRRPLYAAGAATALVVLGGLLLTRPWAQAEAVKTYPVTAPAAPMAVAVNRSAFAPGARAALPPPMVLLPSHANTLSPAYAPPMTGNDPFAGHIPAPYSSNSASPNASSGGSPLWSLPPVPRSAARRRRDGGQSLPPLRLAALPTDGGGGVAPAPISLPPGVAASSVIGSVPQHTVMVASFGNSSAPAAGSDAPDPSSHIRITVHQTSDTETPSVSSVNASGDSGAAGSSGQGETYQQRALALQEAGSYPQARQAYQNAIRSYQTQIATGQDVETAQRGLAACQTGLQICQQSQP